MKGWTKIFSFVNTYEAEIRKQVLQYSGIESIVINAKDSLFLFGDIDLYVKDEDEKKAVYIIEQFLGLTKINSFILPNPIIKFKEYLSSIGIETILKERATEKYILENYELYIENENVDNVLPYLTGEKITGWQVINKCSRVRQARYRVELLEAYSIESFIIKKRNSDFHLEEISIYVEDKNYEKAKELFTELSDWSVIKTFNKYESAELREDLLGKNGIRALIEPVDGQFNLMILNNQKNEADEILNQTKNWIELQRYPTFIDAEGTVLILEQEGIEASIITISDNLFIIGGYAVYVDQSKFKEAVEILTKFKSGKIE